MCKGWLAVIYFKSQTNTWQEEVFRGLFSAHKELFLGRCVSCSFYWGISSAYCLQEPQSWSKIGRRCKSCKEIYNEKTFCWHAEYHRPISPWGLYAVHTSVFCLSLQWVMKLLEFLFSCLFIFELCSILIDVGSNRECTWCSDLEGVCHGSFTL